MKRKPWIWAGGVGALIVIGVVSVATYDAHQAEAKFQEQLRLARADGIPTTAAEFAATIPLVKPEDNAAPYYVKLVNLGQNDQPNAALFYSADPAALSKIQKLIDGAKEKFDLIDQAVSRPHCRFDRDWSLGYAVLFKEFAPMKSAAKYLLLRGNLAAAKGDPSAAIADFKKALVIARHLNEEPTEIAFLVGVAIDEIALRFLTFWAMKYRDQAEYRAALSANFDALPKPNERRLFSSELYCMVGLVDLTMTAKGRKSLGLTDEDLPSLKDRLMLRLLSRGKGKAEIVLAMREMWKALGMAPGERSSQMQKSDVDLTEALMAYPVAYEVCRGLMGGNSFVYPWDIDSAAFWTNVRQRHLAFMRAVCGPNVASKIKTDDLRSPYDGKPLQYSFNGKQIVMVQSPSPGSDDKPITCKIPADPAKR